MNNGTVSGFSSQAYISEVYAGIIQVYVAFGCLTILIYASFLHFADEVKYIWEHKFTPPTYLYLFSKYPCFFYFSLFVFSNLWPEAALSLRLCNDLGILVQVIGLFPFIGVQGLISIRTYSLCQRQQPMLIVLSITFLVALTLNVYDLSVPSCNPVSGSDNFPDNIINIAIIFSDTLAFVTVIRQVWGLWRLKRGLDLQNNEDLITLILRQGFLRFCFVLLITTTELLLEFFSSDVSLVFGLFQNVFSIILICEFTLDLRRRNTRSVPNPSASDLPTLSFREDPVQSVRSVLGRMHENIVAEMGERNDPINHNESDGLNLEERDSLPNDPNDMNLDRDEEPPVQDA